MVQEKISIILEVKDLLSKGLNVARIQLNRIKKDTQGFGAVMSAPLDQLKVMDDRFKGMDTSGGKFAFRLRQVTHGMRGFRMEMLGVMFFGMAIMRMFGGLTRTSMEWFGVTEILTPALGLLFMPIGSFMSDVALKFLDWTESLTESQKNWLNILLALTIGLGAFFALVGTLALGIGSLILVFGGIGFAIAAMSIISAVIIGIGFIVSGVVLLISGKLEGIGLVIMGIGFILLLFIGWWALIPIAVGAAIFLIIKHWDEIKLFLGRVFSAIGGWFKKWFWEKPKEWLNSLLDFVKNIFSKIKDFIGGSFIGKAFNFTSSLLGSFQTGGVVPQTGPYLLHQGETVVPTGQANSGVGASNITNNFYGFTIEELKRELDDRDRKMVSQMEANR